MQEQSTDDERRAKYLARKLRYRERHREEERARHKVWRAANRDYLHEANRQWRLTHAGVGVEALKRWRRRRPDWDDAAKHAQACNRRAKAAGAPGHISRADVTALWERQPRCLRCGQGRGTDHIREFWEGGSNTPENLQNLCRNCNAKKSAVLRFGTSW